MLAASGNPSAATMAAPTIPASLRSSAGTTGVRVVSRGMNLSAFLLTPPPTMNSVGHMRSSMRWRCSSRSHRPGLPREARAGPGPPTRTVAPPGRPRISIWPNSVFGTSVPSTNTPDPTPVPRVRKITTPGRPAPIPKRISAMPAASASLTMLTGRRSDLESFSAIG